MTKGKLEIGPLSPTKYGTGKSFIQESWGTTPAATVCNASSKQPLDMSKVWTSAVRPGSLDFKAWPSRGGC